MRKIKWGELSLYGLIALLVAALIIFAMQPRCDACMHVRHQGQRCGAYIQFGKCVCREDK